MTAKVDAATLLRVELVKLREQVSSLERRVLDLEDRLRDTRLDINHLRAHTGYLIP